jgi:hypothetical protein
MFEWCDFGMLAAGSRCSLDSIARNVRISVVVRYIALFAFLWKVSINGNLNQTATYRHALHPFFERAGRGAGVCSELDAGVIGGGCSCGVDCNITVSSSIHQFEVYKLFTQMGSNSETWRVPRAVWRAKYLRGMCQGGLTSQAKLEHVVLSLAYVTHDSLNASLIDNYKCYNAIR